MLTEAEIQPVPKPKKRIGRARFWLEFFIAAVLVKAGGSGVGVLFTLVITIGLLLAIWASVRRLRDIKRSEWWATILIVPIPVALIFGFTAFQGLDGTITLNAYAKPIFVAIQVFYLLYLGVLLFWPSAFPASNGVAAITEKKPNTEIENRKSKTTTGLAEHILLTAGVLVMVVVPIAVAILGFFGDEKKAQRPQVVTSLVGISIGEKLSDVVFKQGLFKKQEDSEGLVSQYQREEIYRQDDKRVSIRIREGIVTAITYRCGSDNPRADGSSPNDDAVSPKINEVVCGDSGDKIKQSFGNKVRVLCRIKETDRSHLYRVYDVVEYGTRYFLVQNKVTGFYVVDEKRLESLVGFNWSECK